MAKRTLEDIFSRVTEATVTVPMVSREKFLLALKEVEEVIECKKPYTEATEAALHLLTVYTRMKEDEVRAKRKQGSGGRKGG